ncbi:hypothetical protein P692DRAFT_20591190 [Suillus brevipes Sb2]|nr:hypothetical protein P692DRAFT_20591190 [Suillus brevipes Sb2]
MDFSTHTIANLKLVPIMSIFSCALNHFKARSTCCTHSFCCSREQHAGALHLGFRLNHLQRPPLVCDSLGLVVTKQRKTPVWWLCCQNGQSASAQVIFSNLYG